MDIALHYFDGCPNWKITDQHLRSLIEEKGLDVDITYQRIDTPEAAAVHAFHGSPTILVDGVDPFAEADAPIGLTCRIYQTESGPAGSPSKEQLAAVLASVASGTSS